MADARLIREGSQPAEGLVIHRETIRFRFLERLCRGPYGSLLTSSLRPTSDPRRSNSLHQIRHNAGSVSTFGLGARRSTAKGQLNGHRARHVFVTIPPSPPPDGPSPRPPHDFDAIYAIYALS